MADPATYSRRAFLARIGILGAVLGGGGALATMPVWAGSKTSASGPGDAGLKALVDILRPALDAMALDALTALAVFAFPGPDRFSLAQGTPRSEAGGVEARGAQFLVSALDNFVPFPDELARPLAAAFSTALSDLNLPLPNPIAALPTNLVDNVDSALAFLLQNDETIPLSTAIALMLNLIATQVNPLVITGKSDFGPFANLTYAEKAKVFEMIEGADANLVASLDTQVPEPLRSSVSGLLKFVGGSLLEFAAFGNYTEFGAYDTASRQLTSRPVGWEVSGYSPDGVQDGWDELKGYYQGRRHVADV
jgi:hypothetical protein